jgi:NhaA family Na+:H+ antiporter
VSSPPEDPEDAAPDSTTDDASAMARLFIRGSWPETARIADILRKETFGGALLLIAAAAALVWANSPWSATYESLREAEVGRRAAPASLPWDMGRGWAAGDLLLRCRP